MTRWGAWCGGWLWLLGILAGATQATQAAGEYGWIVHFDDDLVARQAAESMLGRLQWLAPNVAVVHPPEDGAGRSAAPVRGASGVDGEGAFWRALSGVRLVEPEVLGRFDGSAVAAAPNDPGFSLQRWLNLNGAQSLWAVADGRGATVAVIDSGVDLKHSDLLPNLLPGYDFADDDPTPQDVLGHGTAVAGLVGAVCNNGLDGCGMAPAVRLMPFKVSRSVGATANLPLASAVAAAILRATALHVDVINLSLSFSEPSAVLRGAIEQALAAGVMVVVAAGNGLATPVAFPANLPGVIAVANSTQDGYLYLTSSFGPEVALAAPGVNPPTTLLGGGFGAFGSGTSFAAPQVAATLAALRGLNPRWSKSLLLTALQQTGLPVAGQRFVRLQAGAAAQWLLPDIQVGRLDPAAGADQVGVRYRLPASETPVDIHLTVDGPDGTFVLGPSGGWTLLPAGLEDSARRHGQSGVAPWLSAYVGAGREGELFGEQGHFPPLLVRGLPVGNYVWRVDAVDSASAEPAWPEISLITSLP